MRIASKENPTLLSSYVARRIQNSLFT